MDQLNENDTKYYKEMLDKMIKYALSNKRGKKELTHSKIRELSESAKKLTLLKYPSVMRIDSWII